MLFAKAYQIILSDYLPKLYQIILSTQMFQSYLNTFLQKIISPQFFVIIIKYVYYFETEKKTSSYNYSLIIHMKKW
jgi:hypothetical protein